MNKFPLAKCELCPLYNEEAVPSTIVVGAEIVFVGEAPGFEETVEGKPFVGQSGQLLREAVSALKHDPDKACYLNVVACRPPGNREPTFVEIENCYNRLTDDIQKCPSGVPIVALGKTACSALNIPAMDNGVWHDNETISTWHPAYVLRKPNEASGFIRDLRIAYAGSHVRDIVPDTQVTHVQDVNALQEYMEEMIKFEWVSVDIETDQINWYTSNAHAQDPVLCMQICWDPKFAVVLDDIMLYDVPGVIPILQKYLGQMKIVGHNFKFDAVFIRSHFGLVLDASFDTYLAHYLLDENLPHGLKEIAKTELGMPDYEAELIGKYLRTKNDHYSKIPFEYLSKYGALDTAVTLILKDVLWKRLQDEGMLEWPMLNILMPLSALLTKVELKGFKVDRNVIEHVRDEFQIDMDAKARVLREMCGFPDLNLDAPAQVAEVIYGYYGFPEQKHWKIKPYSTAHGAIEKWGDHQFIKALLEYRRIAKMKRSYADNIYKYMEPETDIVHGDFRIPGTEVGRISVADPALQTIPRPSEYYGQLIRALFIPRAGCVLVVCDYSQAELRVLGAEAHEQFLIDVYNNNRDLHSEVATAMFGPGFTKEQRVMCKMFNFSYAYGGTERSFAEDAGLDIDVATQFVKQYNQNMPNALAWKLKQRQKMIAQGEVQTRFGRKRRFPLVVNSNIKEAGKAAVHMPVASTANDLTCLSAIALDSIVPDIIVLTVHDSIIAEVPIEDAERVAVIMKQTMEEVASKYVPEVTWKADAEIKDRWAKLPTREDKQKA